MRIRFRNFCLGLVSAAAGLLLAGCNLSQFSAPSAASSVLPGISGKVHGGQQPISGASIYLYAANTSVGKGLSAALLTSPVLTNASGGFSIGAGAYTCPTPGTLVYLTAYGGNPGLPGNVNNRQIGLMVALGTCSSLSTDAFVTVNELTTVASVEALAPFMADGAHLGSDAGNPGGLAGAFATAASMVNFATGQSPPTAAGVTQPTALLNTLADILAACVNSGGRTTPGTSTPCGFLLAYAGLGGSIDTLTAMQQIVQYPASDVAQLFSLVGATSPFQPTLSAAPADFTTPVVINLPRLTTSLPQGYYVIIGPDQHVWVYSSADRYDATAKSYQYATGTVTIFDTNGTVLHTIHPGEGGLYLPFSGVADALGNLWSLNLNGTLSKVSSDGTALSPPGGYPFSFQIPPNLTFGPGQEGDDISFIAADTNGNIWGIASGAGSGCYNEVANNGSAVAVSGNFCAQAGNNIVAEAAADGHGNVWLLGTRTISKVNSSGNLVANGVNANGCVYRRPERVGCKRKHADAIQPRGGYLWFASGERSTAGHQQRRGSGSGNRRLRQHLEC